MLKQTLYEFLGIPANANGDLIRHSCALHRLVIDSNLLGILMCLGFLSGCASVTGSKMQPLSVETRYRGQQVEGAQCDMTNDKGSWSVTTPGTVIVRKSYENLSVTCQKNGFKPGLETFESRANNGAWGNVLAGGLIGYAVDSSSGAGFEYLPNIVLELGEKLSLPVVAPIAQTDWVTTSNGKPRLGITVENISASTATALGCGDDPGVLVVSVEPNSPAQKAGVKNGDVLLTINGGKILSVDSLTSINWEKSHTIKLQVISDKKRTIVDINMKLATKGGI